MGYFQIIRADGISKRYSSMIQMLKDFDRKDLETLWKLVKAKHGSTRLEEGYERVLWGDMKVMFEPNVESEVWRNQQGHKVTVWKLFSSSGVHFVRFQNLHIFAVKIKLLIKKLEDSEDELKFREYVLGLKDFEANLELLQLKGPLVWPSITEDGVTRLKEYVELTPAEAMQADCDIKAINIILQGLPTEIYALVSQHQVAKDLWEKIKLLMQGTSLTKQERECKLYDEFDKFTYKKGESNFVTDVKLVKDLHTTNVDQLHAYLQQHERHANEVRLMHAVTPPKMDRSGNIIRCHVTILNTLDNLGKFDGKFDEGFFVGYSLNSKAFRVYNIRTRKVEENLHIRFLEDKPIFAGDGPKWLFDIDVLTKSMNYVSFVVGTNSNDFVGTEESIGEGHSSKET
ncbi:reverse transcriptase domain-containing protein [Tanacetum coccineum]